MAKNFNHPNVVASYDDHIRALIPGYDLMHMHIRAIIQSEALDHVRIVIAGCGTGYEIEYLLDICPSIEILAIDPAASMIEFAQARIAQHAKAQQVKFVVGDTSVLTQYSQHFDFGLAILVAHFLSMESKLEYFKHIQQSLKPNGRCLSFDLMAFEQPKHLKQLQLVTQQLGLSLAQSHAMIERLPDDFQLVTPSMMKSLFKRVGFDEPICFAQYCNFYGYDLRVPT